ncbi:sarcosine oxidase subunit delta [Falsiroseomonas sp. HW251]|uniref:sarcosine oxidase subunit delta n=1 Tax=Falsiroseomonas sp. HW251 TaxID=3390998 RepID=UPI003D31EBE1
MHRIACPHCGLRDEAEFCYRGDATLARPAPDAGIDAFVAYVYDRDNPRGWHLEWWHHVQGCRRVLKVRRDTLTHEIAWVGTPAEAPP